MLEVERKADGKFLESLHNGGLGSKEYHYQRYKNGKIKYQAVLEIDQVTEFNLVDTSFIDRLVTYSSSTLQSHMELPIILEYRVAKPLESLYEEILPLLEGIIEEPNNDDRKWSHGQLGGSCSVRSLISVLRSKLNTEDFVELKKDFRIFF